VKFTRQTPIEDLPQLLSVEEFCAYTKIGRSAAYDLIRRGAIEYVRFSKIIRIPRRVLERP
jgi:excisionase family DNA binding protein